MVRRSFPAWLGLSLAAHIGVFGVVAVRHDAVPSSEEVAPAPPVLTGDTLDVPGLEPAAVAEEATEREVDLDTATAAREPEGDVPAKPTRPRRPKTVVKGGVSSAAEGSAGDGEPARFGAVGERGSVDLATAFTRGFPQAASADPIWARAPMGSTGTIEVVLALDATGHLTSATLEPGGTPALRQALSKTVALVRGRTFTARREVTRLRVTGSVSPDAVRNGAFGDVFAIGGSFSGRSGSAFFSLAVGRRIDVTITEH